MLELVFILVFLAATAWIAVRAFQHPKGTYLRSLIGLLLGVVAACAVWWLASPVISNEAGLGAFVLFCIVVALCAFVAIVACIAASVRHVLNAFANRRRRS
jgi:peptidoglycan biosynthesis protein MviN/MurJ (putative lipid II flippase)